MTHDITIYIAIMSIVTLLIRVLPLTLIRRPIKSRYIRSFLYYVPYVTLAVMTFPAIVYATQSELSGCAALLAGLAFSYIGCSLFQVAAATSIVVYLVEMCL